MFYFIIRSPLKIVSPQNFSEGSEKLPQHHIPLAEARNIGDGVHSIIQGVYDIAFFKEVDILSFERLIDTVQKESTPETLGAFLYAFHTLSLKLDTYINSQERLKSIYEHDIRNYISIFFSELLEKNPDYLYKRYKSGETRLLFYGKRVLAFIESLYLSTNLSENFLKEKRRTFSLDGALSVASYGSKTPVTFAPHDDITLFGIPGDFTIFIMNIIKNSHIHGKASKIEISVKEGKLIIQDDGKGIDVNILPVMFNKGISGGESTGIGLRDVEQRGLRVSASNEGLPNSTGTKGARFEIVLPLVN